MKTLLRNAFTSTAWQRLDKRLATDPTLRWAIITSGTALSAVCYLLAINAAR